MFSVEKPCMIVTMTKDGGMIHSPSFTLLFQARMRLTLLLFLACYVCHTMSKKFLIETEGKLKTDIKTYFHLIEIKLPYDNGILPARVLT
jgi:hypothetical protein